MRLKLERHVRELTLQARRDVIRTLNQRRLEGARDVRPLGAERLKGVVVKAGFHDEAGAASWVVVRDREGTEHYARLRTGSALAATGRTVILTPLSNGLVAFIGPKGADLSR